MDSIIHAHDLQIQPKRPKKRGQNVPENPTIYLKSARRGWHSFFESLSIKIYDEFTIKFGKTKKRNDEHSIIRRKVYAERFTLIEEEFSSKYNIILDEVMFSVGMRIKKRAESCCNDTIFNHKKYEVHTRGHQIEYLPPYSSFLNPIDNMLNIWKNIVKISNCMNDEKLMKYMNNGVRDITEDDRDGWYGNMKTLDYPEIMKLFS
ncbi:hypothetical protein RF11_06969 [Thelohanellus kitauei]|uniref:Tc1-like transposase DDE domain-containing protein n=1 Tax=Thelohanellus kitauei TaxID=669202 RepID=A0A0C2MC78_THEKT|nr:hypothetical protein RF11_06969 [Thelohanellus kitauei]